VTCIELNCVVFTSSDVQYICFDLVAGIAIDAFMHMANQTCYLPVLVEVIGCVPWNLMDYNMVPYNLMGYKKSNILWH